MVGGDVSVILILSQKFRINAVRFASTPGFEWVPELSTLLTLWDESRFLGLLPWREKELSMWKEQHDAGNTPLEVASAELPELSAEALVEIVTGARDDDRQKLKSEDNLQMEGKKLQKQMEPVALPTMSTYTDALNKFTKNATEFIEHLPLLSEARDAYVQAMKASKELRHVLDSGGQKLQTLMIRMERIGQH
jgi:hypothetical protein